MQVLQDFTQGQVIEELQSVMQKKIYFSDLNLNQNRLFMSIHQLQCMFFITENETRNL